MNQAEVDCLAANTYIELALRADDKSRWRHYAAKGEVHSLRAPPEPEPGVRPQPCLRRDPARRRDPLLLIVNWLAGFCRDLTGSYLDVPEVGRFGEQQARDYVRKPAPARIGTCS